jgi:hypothetical protein
MPGLSQFRDFRPTGIAQTQQLGRFVKGLATGVIDSFSEECVHTNIDYLQKLGMPTGDQKRDKREAQTWGVEQWRQKVPLKMVDRHHGPVQRRRQSIGKAGTYEQRPGKAWPLRHRNTIDRLRRAGCLSEGLL